MAYFQPTWTQTGPGDSFASSTSLITHTETSDSFSSQLDIKSKVIPYAPSGNVVSFTYDLTYSTANISWNPVPIPTIYEVNPVNYSWSLYNSTSSVLVDSGTRTTTSVTSIFGTSEYYFMVYKFYTLNYVNDYFYITTNSTGGGGTSSNAQSVPVKYTPPIMATPSITQFSTFLQGGTYNLNLDFSFETPPSPALVVNTLFTIGLYSNITPTGTYTTCSTIGFYTQQQNPTVVNPPIYKFNLYNLNFTLLPGYYYKTAMVASDMLANVSDSAISEQSEYQFYDPTLERPSAATFTIFQAIMFSNFQVTPANVQNPPIPNGQLNINWTIFSSLNDTVYTTTGISGNFLYATPPGGGLFILPSPITGNAYYKMYVQSTDPQNRAKSSVYYSTIDAGVYAPPAIPSPTITNFTMNNINSFNTTFTVNSLPVPNQGWGWGLYSNSAATGNYTVTSHTGMFSLGSASGGIPTYGSAVTTGTSPNYTFTATNVPVSGGIPFTTDTYYKLVVQGVGSNGTALVSGYSFGPCLIGVSSISVYSYLA